MPSGEGVVSVASWNINSVRARVGTLLDWLREASPDVALLQEIKCLAEEFPTLEVEDLGYNVALCGQKSYNGVAILSKHRLSTECLELPGEPDRQARYTEGLVEVPVDGANRVLRVASIYLPNGNPVGSDRFAYKLAWMEALRTHVRERLALEEVFVLGGDYNVVPTDFDVWNAEAVRADALMQPEVRARYRALLYLGLTDAYRALHPRERGYTFWDYQAGAWRRNHGWRIDHLLLSPQAADRLAAADVDTAPRAGAKPSDHTPVWCALRL
ncbi:MAG: exodeoxyribonuclease III [Rhodospirillaceae bacterium]|nr:exodeoxyribonuclease III [Rhodospirillaceae bacterium]